MHEVDHEYFGAIKQQRWRLVCREELKSSQIDHKPELLPKSFLLSHNNSFLKLGPFQLQIISYSPFKIIAHEFLGDRELTWLKRVGEKRIFATKAGFYKSRSKFNTIQSLNTRLREVIYNETEKYILNTQHSNSTPYLSIPLKNRYSYYVTDDTVFGISRRIEYLTKMNITTRHGSEQYQISTYGLGGKCKNIRTGQYPDWRLLR